MALAAEDEAGLWARLTGAEVDGLFLRTGA